MTETIKLEAELRDGAGKGAARATRRAGRVPAVIYGDKKEPVLISLDPKVLSRELHRGGFMSHLVDIQVGKTSHHTLPRDVQFHPVTDEVLHVDFQRVTSKTVTHVEVAVVFDNADKAPGIKRGGVLNIVRHELELVCGADNIPQSIHIDLSGLQIGDSIHISSVKLPQGVQPAIADRDFTIATIVAPTVVKEDVTDAEAPTAEPAPAPVAEAKAEE
ncbi:MAG TPA: 50S ribosomal protein L25/general stress protein Ctc [Stellaceae bacterium]|jgi:large subunit ribosomal protein L25|nr:50S ribosomal protein L25/general stress protein Ctc [Stellaceae bacterium]